LAPDAADIGFGLPRGAGDTAPGLRLPRKIGFCSVVIPGSIWQGIAPD
jgi:hypothetical protein